MLRSSSRYLHGKFIRAARETVSPPRKRLPAKWPSGTPTGRQIAPVIFGRKRAYKPGNLWLSLGNCLKYLGLDQRDLTNVGLERIGPGAKIIPVPDDAASGNELCLS